MDIVIYRGGQPWAEPKQAAFSDGLRVHGIAPEFRKSGNWRASDLAVVWGHRDHALHEIQRAHGGRYLVLERAYIGDIHERRRWCSIGYDGLNGNADFCNAGSPPDRWEKYFAHTMKPWRSRDDGYALLIGQIPGDASLGNVNHPAWLADMCGRLNGAGTPVVFRPHPQAMERANGSVRGAYGFDVPVEISTRPLADDLAAAKLVITWNSNVGVDAALAGVPVVALGPGSMAHDVAGHELDEIVTPDRTQFAANLAYTQWLDSEIASGEAWEHLKPKGPPDG